MQLDVTMIFLLHICAKDNCIMNSEGGKKGKSILWIGESDIFDMKQPSQFEIQGL